MAEAQAPGNLEAIVRRQQAMVFSIAYHLLHDRALAEEVAQDVFLQLHDHLRDLQSGEHVVSWLRRVTVHRAIDCARKRKARPEVELDAAAQDAPELAAPADTNDLFLTRRLQQLVASLPEKARAVVVLRYQEDMDPTEIARVLEMPLATVKSHLQRSLATLREKIARTLGEVKR